MKTYNVTVYYYWQDSNAVVRHGMINETVKAKDSLTALNIVTLLIPTNAYMNGHSVQEEK